MPPPRNGAGRPPTQEERPAENTSSAAAKQTGTGSSLVIVRQDDRTRRYPRADASLYEPVSGRGRAALSIRCPICGGVHLGRLRPGTDPDGKRRTPCGTVQVRVRRRYAPRKEAAA